jgi:hypothetical protein
MKPFRHRNVFEEIKNKSHDEDWVALPARVATAARPGTAEKIEVMVARLEAGEELHHPNDEKRPGTIEQSSQMQLLVSAARKEKQEQDRAERLAKETKRERRSIKQTRDIRRVKSDRVKTRSDSKDNHELGQARRVS